MNPSGSDVAFALASHHRFSHSLKMVSIKSFSAAYILRQKDQKYR